MLKIKNVHASEEDINSKHFHNDWMAAAVTAILYIYMIICATLPCTTQTYLVNLYNNPCRLFQTLNLPSIIYSEQAVSGSFTARALSVVAHVNIHECWVRDPLGNTDLYAWPRFNLRPDPPLERQITTLEPLHICTLLKLMNNWFCQQLHMILSLSQWEKRKC